GARAVPQLAAGTAALFDTFKGSIAYNYNNCDSRLLVINFDDPNNSTHQVCSPLSPRGDTAMVLPRGATPTPAIDPARQRRRVCHLLQLVLLEQQAKG
ncbi:unnamed protein product, partial [Urochloa humidicola]